MHVRLNPPPPPPPPLLRSRRGTEVEANSLFIYNTRNVRYYGYSFCIHLFYIKVIKCVLKTNKRKYAGGQSLSPTESIFQILLIL